MVKLFDLFYWTGGGKESGSMCAYWTQDTHRMKYLYESAIQLSAEYQNKQDGGRVEVVWFMVKFYAMSSFINVINTDKAYQETSLHSG